MHTQQPGGWISYAIPLVVVAVVMAIRWRRMSRVRPLKLERLWILPAVYAVVIGFTFSRFPPHGAGWAFCLVALALGGALGWQRGKMMRITLDPETHDLGQTSSPAALLFIVLLVVVRSGARGAMSYGGGGFDPMAVTDVLMALALGLFTAQRLEMYLRGKRMLAAARAA
ncbi:cytochrome c biogenesis protein CcdC [Sphingomonas sp. RP10(2022)]|uniref:Cytochrome c biogenesis protein CcdC n=1 Tax=Sphingomonas liriopis TaxID=2949094 RepID=A0A9X2HYK7_9SPHN|nr:CcdC protein domain-containing protein [Sphingomonas liriopis]MCP3735185.1 cytochrome c biogenesis protein CcdC [Sphingomonas liriopis]